MQDHYKIEKMKKTTKLLERTLIELEQLIFPITLNKIYYKKLSYSNPQIINAMFHFATKEEINDGIPILDPSTISKSDLYKNIINKFKLQNIENTNLSRNLNFKKMYTEIELKLYLENSLAKIKLLEERNKMLEKFIEEHEIEKTLKNSEKLTNIGKLDSDENKLGRILLRLLEKLNYENHIKITPAHNGNITTINYVSFDGIVKVCNLSDLDELNYRIEKDDNNRLFIKENFTLD